MNKLKCKFNCEVELYYEFDKENNTHCWYDTECKSFNAVCVNADLHGMPKSLVIAAYHMDKIIDNSDTPTVIKIN